MLSMISAAELSKVLHLSLSLQLVFAVVSPGAVLPNLVAGAIAEAGAQQAGDLMQVCCEFHSVKGGGIYTLHIYMCSRQLLSMFSGPCWLLPLGTSNQAGSCMSAWAKCMHDT